MEEHLHQLWVVFDQFREYNFKLKPSKCNQVSKEGLWPSNSNLKVIAECPLPQTYTEVCAFLGLMGHYWWFIKGFMCVAQLLNKHLTGEGSSRKFKWISLSEGALEACKALKKTGMTTPILAFAHYTRPFLLETDASKDRLGVVLSQRQMDGWYHPVAYGSRALTSHEKNYHSTKFEFLVLKWAVTEH